MSTRVCQLSFLLIFFVLSASAQRGANPAILVTAEPYYHQLLDNASVRAFRLELPPGKTTQLHWHDCDFMTVTLEDSTVTEVIMRPDTVDDARVHVLSQGEMAVYELKKDFGAAWRTPAGIVHTLSNKSDKPYANVTFEIKNGHSVVADGEALIVKPDAPATREWQQTDHLLIAMNECEMSDSGGTKRDAIRLKSGDVMWIPRGSTHTFTNVGKEPALATTFEFK